MITTILGMRDELLPPTINLEAPDPECDLDYVPKVPKSRSIRIAMSNSFGLAGITPVLWLKSSNNQAIIN